jgi:hypothetical protein
VFDERESCDGPSPHAVTLARIWLNIGGVLWIGFAIMAWVTSGGIAIWPTAALGSIALLHFVIAKFGSHRVAVFFAIFGP